MSEEKNKTEAELQERARLAQQLVVEKQQLEEKTSNLKEDLLVCSVCRSLPPSFLPFFLSYGFFLHSFIFSVWSSIPWTL